MSDLAPSYRSFVSGSTLIAVVLACAAVATWLAATAVDELWVVAPVVGLAAAALGWKARRDARRRGTRGTLGTVALVVGGLVAAQVIAFTVGWGIYHLMS